MKLLFLGLGFISFSVAYELAESHDITLTTRELPPRHPVKRAYAEMLESKGVKLERLDVLNDREKLAEMVRGSDAVVNFIGEIQGDEKSLLLSNAEIPKRLVEAIETSNPKVYFIHFSGATLGQQGKYIKEEVPHGSGLNPSTPFERSKLEGEKAVMSSSIQKAIVRPTLVYGWAAAHPQFVVMYRLAKLGIRPGLGLEFMPVSTYYIAKLIDKLLDTKPKAEYLYATECKKVTVEDFVKLYCEALNKGCFRIPVPTALAKAFLPRGVKDLLRYSGVEFSCEKMKGYVGEMTFREEDVLKNAEFLGELEAQGRLVPE